VSVCLAYRGIASSKSTEHRSRLKRNNNRATPSAGQAGGQMARRTNRSPLDLTSCAVAHALQRARCVA
jgi:hypothetical protein